MVSCVACSSFSKCGLLIRASVSFARSTATSAASTADSASSTFAVFGAAWAAFAVFVIFRLPRSSKIRLFFTSIYHHTVGWEKMVKKTSLPEISFARVLTALHTHSYDVGHAEPTEGQTHRSNHRRER